MRAPLPGQEILVRALTSCYRIRMKVDRVVGDAVICGRGERTRTVCLSGYRKTWWEIPAGLTWISR